MTIFSRDGFKLFSSEPQVLPADWLIRKKFVCDAQTAWTITKALASTIRTIRAGEPMAVGLLLGACCQLPD
jgi:hypothetical protein